MFISKFSSCKEFAILHLFFCLDAFLLHLLRSPRSSWRFDPTDIAVKEGASRESMVQVVSSESLSRKHRKHGMPPWKGFFQLGAIVRCMDFLELKLYIVQYRASRRARGRAWQIWRGGLKMALQAWQQEPDILQNWFAMDLNCWALGMGQTSSISTPCCIHIFGGVQQGQTQTTKSACNT